MSSLAPALQVGPGGPTKSPRILACVLCQHRKIKCDRSFPCSHCLKANVQCTPSTPAPARKRRRPNQDLQERLARCEELLKEYNAAEGSKSPTEAQTPPASKSPTSILTPEGLNKTPLSSTSSDVHVPATWQPHGKVVNEDGTVRFIDSYLLGTIHDELRAMREIIDNDEASPEDDTSDSHTPDTHADLLLGGETPMTTGSTQDLQPAPQHVFRLWQVFLERVNPLLKIIHVPTLQPYLVEAAGNSQGLPNNIEALLFSIYTLAVVALTDEECQTLIGSGREAALQRFSTGVRTSLTRIGFLKNHDLASLQALVMYLISLQGRYNKWAAWILNGVVIRIAQKMGLHRDGEALGLSPFETEMRRRLWWQIISLDVRYAISSGLGHSLLPRGWDTKEPKNINDADLHPNNTEPIQDRDGPTEMIFAMMVNTVSKFISKMPVLEPIFLFSWFDTSNIPNAPSPEQLQELRSMFEQLVRTLLELLDKNCDPSAGPLHAFTVDFKAIVLQKLRDFFSPGKQEIAEGLGLVSPTQKDHLFLLSVSAAEHTVESYHHSGPAGFLWFTRLQFQMDVPIFVAGQLCARPTGKLVDRAWAAIETILQFHPELLRVNASKENMLLGTYMVKAWKVREEFHHQQGIHLPTPEYIQQLQSVIPPEHLEGKTPQILTPPEQRQIHGSFGGNMYAPIKNEGVVPSAESTMEPNFDDFLGNYLEPDWDMFSAMTFAATTSPAVATATGAVVPSSTTTVPHQQQPGNPNPNQNHMGNAGQPDAASFGGFSFGLGPNTEW